MKNIVIGILLGIIMIDKLQGTQLQNFIGVSITASFLSYVISCKVDDLIYRIHRKKRLKDTVGRIAS